MFENLEGAAYFIQDAAMPILTQSAGLHLQPGGINLATNPCRRLPEHHAVAAPRPRGGAIELLVDRAELGERKTIVAARNQNFAHFNTRPFLH